MRTSLIVAALTALLLAAGAQTASAASRTWRPCSKAATKAAAERAGLPARMDADARLRSIFGEDAPSSQLTSIGRSLCADFDGDGDLDRLALYRCCTVSSPAPFAILRKSGASYAIAYSRLNDAVITFSTAGRDLVEREPKYARTDANCCPSRVRERRIHWTGTGFATRVRIRAAPAGARTIAAPAAAASAARPAIIAKPIPFPARRKREMAVYARRHYGIDGHRLRRPRVIVEHYTVNDSVQATFNTFAPDVADAELHELPGVCAHFVIGRDGGIHQFVSLKLMCRHTVGLNHTSIGIEHVGRSDRDILGNAPQLRASLRLTAWLRCRYEIGSGNVIGHSESLSSPYHRERVARLRTQTHGDFKKASMDVYRRKLRARPCA